MTTPANRITMAPRRTPPSISFCVSLCMRSLRIVPAQLARVKADTSAAFDQRAQARVAERQRTAALSALFYVGGQDSLRKLKPLLQTDRDDPFLKRTLAAIARRH